MKMEFCEGIRDVFDRKFIFKPNLNCRFYVELKIPCRMLSESLDKPPFHYCLAALCNSSGHVLRTHACVINNNIINNREIGKSPSPSRNINIKNIELKKLNVLQLNVCSVEWISIRIVLSLRSARKWWMKIVHIFYCDRPKSFSALNAVAKATSSGVLLMRAAIISTIAGKLHGSFRWKVQYLHEISGESSCERYTEWNNEWLQTYARTRATVPSWPI